jgi:hypothetical protein
MLDDTLLAKELKGRKSDVTGMNKLEAVTKGKPVRSLGCRSGEKEPLRVVEVTAKKGKRMVTERKVVPWLYPAVVGSYIKKMEKPMRAALNEIYCASVCTAGFTCFAKGLPPDEVAALIGKIMDSTGYVAICFDSSKWDGAVSEDALVYEHRVWKHFNGSPLFAKMLAKQLLNKVTWETPEGSFGATMKGRRMSGDPNTGSGNDIINSAILASLLRKLRCKGHFLVQGDDSILFVPKAFFSKALEEIVPHYESYGFRGEVECVGMIPEHVEFCHIKPVRAGSGWRAVKNVDELVKDLRTVKQFGPKPSKSFLKDYFKTRAEAASIVYDGLPVFQDLAKNLSESAGAQGGKFRASLLDRYYLKMAMKWGHVNEPPDPVSFSLTQNISPSQLDNLAQFYAAAEFTFDPGGPAKTFGGLW